MTVTSRPIENKPVDVQPVVRQRESLVPAGIAALMFGIPLWFVSARYSLDGWVMAINVAAKHVGLPLVIPVITGWWSLLLVPLGLVYSLVEVKYNPFRYLKKSPAIGLVFLATWLFIHGTDLGTTFLSATMLHADAWEVSTWIAQHLVIAVLWSIFLTYLPERLIMAGSKWIGFV